MEPEKSKQIASELVVKATAGVTASVEEDLKVADPTPEQAKAILDENTQGDDRGTGNKHDNKSSQ
jgi:hypothetical protein